MSVQMVKSFVKAYSSEILMGVGISGMVSTVILAVKATPKALSLIDDELYYRYEEEKTDDISYAEWLGVGEYDIHTKLKCISFKDKVRVSWKCYIPTAAMMSISIGCLVGSSSVSARRNAVLATAYSLTDSAFHDYKNKVIETMGEKKDKEVRGEIIQDKLDSDIVEDKTVEIAKGGSTMCYDSVFGRYFESDRETIRQIENELNKKMRTELFISLNDFYYEIGLSPVKYGDNLGWCMDDEYIDISYHSHLTSNGTPCLAIDYSLKTIV